MKPSRKSQISNLKSEIPNLKSQISDPNSPIQSLNSQISDPKSRLAPLPDGWRWAKLKQVCEVNPRRSMIERRDEEPTSFVPMEAIDAVRGIIADLRTRPFGAIKSGYTFFTEGDVLFAKITPCMQNGKHVIAEGLIDGIGFGTTEFHVLRPQKGITSEWIHMFVRQPPVLIEAVEHLTGAVGQQRLPSEYLANLDIPLPPLPEQQRIAAILKEQMTAVENARAAAQARLEAVNALSTCFLRQVFPRPAQRLPDGWQWIPFGEITENHDGRRIPVRQADRQTGRFPYYGASGIIDHVARYLFDGDYLLVAEDGANLLARSTPIAFHASGKFWVNNHAHVVQPKSNVLLNYLVHFFAASDIGTHVKGAAQPKLNQNDLNAIDVPLPPVSEQHRLVEMLAKQLTEVETIHVAAEEELQEINALPAALLRRAFNGEL